MNVLAAIPYTTFPRIEVGPLSFFTFGLMVAIGIAVGTWVAATTAARWGIDQDEVYGLAIKLVVVGFVGSRVTWVLTNAGDLDSPAEAFTVWEGGLQFSGAFVFASLAAFWLLRDWSSIDRWRLLDSSLLGLTIGMAIGRVGCYSVGEHLGGEHLGGETSFFLATRYEGGDTQEGALQVGQVVHSCALYEALWCLPLFGALLYLARRRSVPPGLMAGVFLVGYGLARFGTDFLRAYDRTVLGLTGAQYLCLLLVPAGIYVLATTRSRAERLGAGGPSPAPPDPESASTASAA